jgi:hypothetical protein
MYPGIISVCIFFLIALACLFSGSCMQIFKACLNELIQIGYTSWNSYLFLIVTKLYPIFRQPGNFARQYMNWLAKLMVQGNPSETGNHSSDKVISCCYGTRMLLLCSYKPIIVISPHSTSLRHTSPGFNLFWRHSDNIMSSCHIIILPSTSRSCKWLIILKFSYQNVIRISNYSYLPCILPIFYLN